jgi:acetyl esterase/lipase
VIHGGGWDSGNRSQLTDLNFWLSQRGYAVAAISYRLAPSHIWPTQRDDVRAAVNFLSSQASELGIESDNFVLLGRSAGGQIAETVAYAEHDLPIRGVVGLYAPSDLRFAYKYSRDDDILKSPALLRRYLGGPPETAGANFDSATALGHVTRNCPPTLLIHGENDTLVWHRHSVRLEAVLERAGVPCVFVSLPWATHAFEFSLQGPGGQVTIYALDRFLAKVTARSRKGDAR